MKLCDPAADFSRTERFPASPEYSGDASWEQTSPSRAAAFRVERQAAEKHHEITLWLCSFSNGSYNSQVYESRYLECASVNIYLYHCAKLGVKQRYCDLNEDEKRFSWFSSLWASHTQYCQAQFSSFSQEQVISLRFGFSNHVTHFIGFDCTVQFLTWLKLKYVHSFTQVDDSKWAGRTIAM